MATETAASIVHSAEGTDPLARGHAAVLSVTPSLIRRSDKDGRAFHNSPFCYWLNRRISEFSVSWSELSQRVLTSGAALRWLSPAPLMPALS